MASLRWNRLNGRTQQGVNNAASGDGPERDEILRQESHPVFSLNASAANKSQQDRYHGDYQKDMNNTSNTENKSTEKPTYDKDDCYDV
jgi:hypothetical protein